MPDRLPPAPPRTRWLRLAVLALGAVALAAASLAAAAPAGTVAPGDVLWFGAPPKEKLVHRPRFAGWTSRLRDAPDGADTGLQVVDLVYNPEIGSSVDAVPRPARLRTWLASLGFGRAVPPVPLGLRVVDETETASGRWVACTLDVAALPDEWHPADLVGTWVHDGPGIDETTRLAFLADGRLVDAAPPGAERGRWAERQGHLFFRWLHWPAPGYGDHVEVFRVAADRRTYGRRYAWAPSRGGRRE